MLILTIQSLKIYLLTVENFITFISPTQIPWRFAREYGNKIKFLYFFVDYIIESLLAMTWTVLKFDRITAIFNEEFPEFIRNERCMNLIRMQQWIKDSLSSVDWIHNNNDSIDVR